jgi:hypothetical protein
MFTRGGTALTLSSRQLHVDLDLGHAGDRLRRGARLANERARVGRLQDEPKACHPVSVDVDIPHSTGGNDVLTVGCENPGKGGGDTAEKLLGRKFHGVAPQKKTDARMERRSKIECG